MGSQINSATSTTSSGSPRPGSAGADLASTDADGVVQPAIGVAVGLMKYRPDDLPASGVYARALCLAMRLVPSVSLVDRDVAAAGGVEWLPIPAAVAFAQPQAGLLSHQVQFVGPGGPQGH